jgi:hypothetical protein
MTRAASTAPTLPLAEAKAPAPMISHATPGGGSKTWYRTDQQRYRSVYRRANPWYRRIARALIGLSILALVGAGLYFGAHRVQDYIERDRLPPPGQEPPAFASTSFLVVSSAPAPELNGTVTVDTSSRAFEFVGAAGGPQESVEVVSPDGTRVYVRTAGGPWRAASADDPSVEAVVRALPYLLGVDDADDVLENRLRKGYVELTDETTEGAGAEALERYELALDTGSYSEDYPLQWQSYQQSVVPGMVTAEDVPLVMWIDDDNAIVRFRDDASNWSWDRLTYSSEPFVPVDPSGVAG